MISVIRDVIDIPRADKAKSEYLALRLETQKKSSEYLTTLKDKQMRHEKVLNLLQQLRDVSEQQSNLALQLDRPSSSASHSRFKNEIVQKLKSLNEDRTRIMQEIVDSGADPVLRVIMPNGTANDMKISEIINMHNKPDNTDSIKPRKRHLRLIKNEDNNGSEPASSSKIH